MDREILATDAIAAAAGGCQRLTYGQLAQRIGGTARGMRHVLDAVGDRSMVEHGFRLDALVVSHKTGEPGEGFDRHVPSGEDRTLFVRHHQSMAFRHYGRVA